MNATEKLVTGVDLLTRAMNGGGPELLDAAIGLLTESSAELADDDPNKTTALANLGSTFVTRFRHGGDPADLDRAVAAGTRALAAVPADEPQRDLYLLNLRTAYWLRFRHGNGSDDLDCVIAIGEQLIASIGREHPGRPGHLTVLADAYQYRFDRGEARGDIDRAVTLREQSFADTPPDSPDYGNRLAGLVGAVQLRFEYSRAAKDLDRAAELGERLVRVNDGDDARQLGALRALHGTYQRRYERGEALSDLDRMIELREEALRHTPPGHPEHRDQLAFLVRGYELRFDRTAVGADLDRQITLDQKLAATLPDNDHERAAGILANLADKCRRRFDNMADPADLDHAIRSYERAVEILPKDHRAYVDLLNNLGGVYLARFETSAVPADLDRAVDTNKQAVAAASSSKDTRLGTCLSNLGNVYRARFEHAGIPEDLDRAVAAGEQAVAEQPADDPELGSDLTNLGNTYLVRFQYSGNPEDLDRAIRLYEQAVPLAETNPNGAAIFVNLGNAYRLRFDRDGVLEDLHRAVAAGERGLASTPAKHPTHARRMANLGGYYHARFNRTQEKPDLDRAISLGEQAIAAIPMNSPEQAMFLTNLSLAYRKRFEAAGTPDDLDRAVATAERAVVTGDGHPTYGGMLLNLGLAYERRFEHAGRPADLGYAIEVTEQAVEATPESHLHRATVLTGLASRYLTQVEAGRHISQQVMETLCRQVADASASSAEDRMLAYASTGMLAMAMNDRQATVELLDHAVALLPSVTPRTTGWADREHRFGKHAGLVSEAVAAHCAVGDPAGAVETAELGRGILLATHLESRSDLTDLARVDAGLATRFREIRDQINVSDDRTTHLTRLWADHDQVLTRIRQLPGFDRFLLPPRLTDLRPAATGGAVLLVNVGTHRGDAIIVTADADPIPVPLPDLSQYDVGRRALSLLEATHDQSLTGALRRPRIIQDILGWLWDTIVAPVLDALPPAESTQLPRVWWMPTGVLGLFPLHVAGHVGAPGALERVVSSYTPTLRTLGHMRVRPPATARRQLTVALEHTPGHTDLPGTVAEAADLHSQHPDMPTLLNAGATTNGVLTALPDATWAHFACHAHTDLAAPSRGGLRLHDDTLPIPEISRLQLTHAELAYLSACSTAHRGWRHADESIHLASAFQLAGFRHVIASLWPLGDHIAATAARSFYDQLPDTPTADHAAVALRDTIIGIRATHPNRPDFWAPLIHSGP